MAPPRPQQKPMAAMLALTAALALACLPPAAAVKAISSWNSGLITHFGGAQDGEQWWGRLAVLRLDLAAARGGRRHGGGVAAALECAHLHQRHQLACWCQQGACCPKP